MSRGKLLLKSFNALTYDVFNRNISGATALITKARRRKYNRTYPTLLVLSNGATVEIRYPEPRMIIKLPLDASTLSDDEKRAYLEQRKPKHKVVVAEETKISYDPSKYVNLIRKK